MTDFQSWLATQGDRDDPVGDLARDVRADPDWPGFDDLPVLRGYLRNGGAAPEALDALARAFGEWTASA